MCKLKLKNFWSGRDESIFREDVEKQAVWLVVLYFVSFFIYDKVRDLCIPLLNDSFVTAIRNADYSGFFDAQLNLLGCAISTLAIVTTFLEQRYLGASYKYWLFKHTPDRLTPQENILLMAVNLLGNFPCVVTGEYKVISIFSFLISWYLFLYLIYQIYCYVVKVSHVLHKVRDKIIQAGEWNKDCERIYGKLIALRDGDANKSYVMEEVEIVIQMLKNSSDPAKTRNLKKVVMCLYENSISNHNESIVAPDLVKRNRANEIIDLGNTIVSSDQLRYTYQDHESPSKNLLRALNKWFSH